MYNSIPEKTVRGNSIDAKQFDDNVPHLSLARSVRRCNIVGAPFFRYGEDRYDLFLFGGSLIIQFRGTPTAFVRNSAPVVIGPHFLRRAL